MTRCKNLLEQSAENLQLREDLLKEKDKYVEARKQLDEVMKDRVG